MSAEYQAMAISNEMTAYLLRKIKEGTPLALLAVGITQVGYTACLMLGLHPQDIKNYSDENIAAAQAMLSAAREKLGQMQ